MVMVIKLSIELNHYRIQQVRIPLNEKISIRKICQIFLNYGYYEGMTFSDNHNELNYWWQTLEDYLDKEDINNFISKDLITEITSRIIEIIPKEYIN